MGQIGEQDSNNITFNLQCKHESDIENKEKKYKCSYPDCYAVFLRPSKLERHIRLHTGERPYKCSHPDCTKSYTNSSHLKRHLETHNPMKKVYKCTKCPMTVSYRHNLKLHYKMEHSEEKRFSCKECNETFNKKYQFVKHQATHSTTSIIYKCDKCNRSYLNHNKFKQHQEIHNKSYPCPISGCLEVFDKWVLLRTHKATKHKTNYKCDTCDKVFFNKARLKIHSKIHSEDRLVLPCPYDNCHRFYFFKSNLEEHVRIKHLGKKFFCDICSMGLSSKQRLIEHIQRHYEPKKKKKKKRVQRKKRRDTGISKKSTLTSLIGINLPHHLEKMMMEREPKIKNKQDEQDEQDKKMKE